MTDLNTAIAKYLGWKCYEQPRSGYRLQYVYAPGKYPWDNHRDKDTIKNDCVEIELTQIDFGKFDGQKLPDYEHDARLYMALYFELHVDVRMRLAISKPETFGHDVCFEFCRLKGIEVVG
jgi:hypothetical protein